MTGARRCPGCAAHNGENARFCRHCGAPLGEPGPAIGSAPDGVLEKEILDSARSSAVSVDTQRVFRELCWLCAVVIVSSVAYAVYVRIWGVHPAAEVVVVSAVALLALVGFVLNSRLVGASLVLPNARGLLDTGLVALVAGPSLTFGFWLLGLLGFGARYDYWTAYARDGWPVWVGFVLVAMVTPLSEELLFRGLIQPKLEQLIDPTEALIVQAALFSALHLNPVILVTHFGMGLAFGWLRRRTGSLFPGVVLHGAWNAWVLAVGVA